MAKKKSEIFVLWPEYFNSNLSRSQGRRVSSEISVPDPTCENIFKICRKMGLYPQIEGDKSHPSTWYRKDGRVTIRKTGKKTEIIQAIGKNLKKVR